MKLFKILMVVVLSVCMIQSYPILADTKNNACSVKVGYLPYYPEPVLLEDNSYIEDSDLRSIYLTVNVDKKYSVPLQDTSGSCTSSASVRVTGTYEYEGSSGFVTQANLKVETSYIPDLWEFVITVYETKISGPSIKLVMNYYSDVDDPFGCMVGGGRFYTSATLNIK